MGNQHFPGFSFPPSLLVGQREVCCFAAGQPLLSLSLSLWVCGKCSHSILSLPSPLLSSSFYFSAPSFFSFSWHEEGGKHLKGPCVCMRRMRVWKTPRRGSIALLLAQQYKNPRRADLLGVHSPFFLSFPSLSSPLSRPTSLCCFACCCE